MKEQRILVVGGGPAGLAAARALDDLGTVRLVELRPQLDTTGGGIYIPSNGVRMLDNLGLLDAARDVGHVVAGQEMRDAVTGQPIGAADLTQIWPERWPCLAMLRRNLVQILSTDLAVPIEYGRGVRTVNNNDDVVEVSFTDGTADEFDLVVAADGVWSAVRGALLPDARPSFSGETYWRGVLSNRPDWLQHWTGFMGDARFVGVIPVGPDETYCFGFILQDAPHDLPGDLGTMHEQFTTFPDAATEVIDGIDPATLTFNHAWAVTLPTSVVGRCVIIGDAAHASSPSMAQGAALGFEDAVVLATIVADVGHPLDHYEQARVNRVRYVGVKNRQRTEALKLPQAMRNEILADFHSITERTFAPLQSDPRAAIPRLAQLP